ncbi:class I adenylate-forming enzyme family protein [Pseudomonas coronafaciens]|uniref:class I adenylate-forming enzyme family protein n=1 Tax=Pseudomonas coronafaciens TaxID=53409 RepID=UPI0006D62464|nr:class I adenylate-forming enzyme family protein [Pseudomonas coronafaciens]KPZ26179.1 Coronafacic acid synthetase, ligase component [Pseudomonas coronafaciens pv. zizaniae]
MNVVVDTQGVQALFERVLPMEAGSGREPFEGFATLCEGLQRLGVKPGRAVLVALPNGTHFVALLFALLLLGAVPTPLPYAAPPGRIRRIAKLLGADLLILPCSAAIKALDAREAGRLSSELQWARLKDIVTLPYEPGEVVLLTSGTSGIFSGCVFDSAALLLNARRHAASIGQSAADRLLINLPLFYSFAFVAQLLSSYVLGNEVVLATPPFTPIHYHRTLLDLGITLSSLTPVMVTALCAAELDGLPPSLRRLTIGGDALAANLVPRLLARNPDLELYLTYGLTQAGPRVATLAAHLEPAERHASVGRPLPEVEVELGGAPGASEGELLVVTDTAMQRRIRAGETDRLPPLRGQKRLVATGDHFHIDADGYLFFRQRNPTFVMRRGEKLCPRSICEIVESLPGIVSAEAWVRPNAGPNDEVALILDVQSQDPDLNEQALRQQLAGILLRAEQPDRLDVTFAQHAIWQKGRR